MFFLCPSHVKDLLHFLHKLFNQMNACDLVCGFRGGQSAFSSHEPSSEPVGAIPVPTRDAAQPDLSQALLFLCPGWIQFIQWHSIMAANRGCIPPRDTAAEMGSWTGARPLLHVCELRPLPNSFLIIRILLRAQRRVWCGALWPCKQSLFSILLTGQHERVPDCRTPPAPFNHTQPDSLLTTLPRTPLLLPLSHVYTDVPHACECGGGSRHQMTRIHIPVWNNPSFMEPEETFHRWLFAPRKQSQASSNSFNRSRGHVFTTCNEQGHCWAQTASCVS